MPKVMPHPAGGVSIGTGRLSILTEALITVPKAASGSQARAEGPDWSAEFENGRFYYAVWVTQPGFIQQSSNAPAVPMQHRSESSKNNTFAVVRTFASWSFLGRTKVVWVVGTSIAQVAGELKRLALTLVGVGLGLTVFWLCGGWWVAGMPCSDWRNSATAKQIAGGNRAPADRYSGNGKRAWPIAEVIEFRRLTSRTPLLSSRCALPPTPRTNCARLFRYIDSSSIGAGRERDGQEYRESLQICQRAAERMRVLVNSLLELAR